MGMVLRPPTDQQDVLTTDVTCCRSHYHWCDEEEILGWTHKMHPCRDEKHLDKVRQSQVNEICRSDDYHEGGLPFIAIILS